MALIVRSAKHKKGTFEGKAYDNITIFAENPDSTNDQLVFGAEMEILKMKIDDFTSAFNHNKANGFGMVQEMQGALIQPVYDKWGNVTDFTLFKSDDKGAQGK